MDKIKIGAKNYLYPMPTVIIGADVKGKPNFLTVAFCGIVQFKPPMFAFASNIVHYTNAGIKETGTFSVNIPGENLLKAADYVGIHSGKHTDKSKIFETFYGELKTAPMIRECPLCLECRLIQTFDVGGTNDIFLGEIVESYSEERFLTDGLPDMAKMKPVAFSMYDNRYWSIGAVLGKSWEIGKDFRA